MSEDEARGLQKYLRVVRICQKYPRHHPRTFFQKILKKTQKNFYEKISPLANLNVLGGYSEKHLYLFFSIIYIRLINNIMILTETYSYALYVPRIRNCRAIQLYNLNLILLKNGRNKKERIYSFANVEKLIPRRNKKKDSLCFFEHKPLFFLTINPKFTAHKHKPYET